LQKCDSVDENVMFDMITRIERRFGDISSLLNAYECCSTDAHAMYLLSDLSLAASNICDEVEVQEASVGNVDMQHASLKIWEALCHRSGHLSSHYPCTPLRLSKSNYIERQTYVTMSSSMQSVLGNINGFGESIKFTIMTDAAESDSFHQQIINHPKYPWCEVTTQSKSTSTNVPSRSSGGLYVVVIPGKDVVEAFASSYDELSSECKGQRGRQFEMLLIQSAWKQLQQRFCEPFVTKIGLEREGSRNPQIAILIEGLGRGSGMNGACGLLKKVYAQARHHNHNIDNLDEDGGDAACFSTSLQTMRLTDDGTEISLESANYITSHLSWIVNLFSAVASIELDYQIFLTEVKSTNEYISTMICEMQKVALLLYHPMEESL
jgi:hypothetical protein